MSDEKFDTIIPQAMTALATMGVLFVMLHSAFANVAGSVSAQSAHAKPGVVYVKHAPANAPVRLAAIRTNHG
jgi:hypothetical protein